MINPQPKIISSQTQFETDRTNSVRVRIDWLLLAGFCGFLFFFGLASFGLLGADEPRYAQVAREMLARHDWISPTLGGKPWLEKPPLYYWQAIVAYSIFGISDWAARLPSAVDTTLLIVAIYLFLRRFRPGYEINGALMTASAAGIIGFARAASTDMPLSAMFGIALLAWYAWFESEQRKYLAVSYAFLALATLAKGPVAPLLALVILALFAVAKAGFQVFLKTCWIPGISLFCAITLPWYVAVQFRIPEFFRVFFLEHNLARFGTNLYHHPEPFWYFLPVTMLGLLPWVVTSVASLGGNIRTCWAEKHGRPQDQDSLNVFLVIWLLVPVLFFSLSKSKLPGYILPSLPAGTLLAAEYVSRKTTAGERLSAGVSLLHAIATASLMVPALMIQYLVLQHRLPWGKGAAISFSLAAVLAIGTFLTLRTKAGSSSIRFVSLAVIVLAVGGVLRLGAPAVDSTLSARPLAQELARMESRPMTVAVFRIRRETEYGLAFYRNQVISRYERGEVPSTEHLVIAPEGSQVALARLVAGRRVSYLGSFAAQGLDYYWVAGAER